MKKLLNCRKTVVKYRSQSPILEMRFLVHQQALYGIRNLIFETLETRKARIHFSEIKLSLLSVRVFRFKIITNSDKNLHYWSKATKPTFECTAESASCFLTLSISVNLVAHWQGQPKSKTRTSRQRKKLCGLQISNILNKQLSLTTITTVKKLAPSVFPKNITSQLPRGASNPKTAAFQPVTTELTRICKLSECPTQQSQLSSFILKRKETDTRKIIEIKSFHLHKSLVCHTISFCNHIYIYIYIYVPECSTG